MALAVALSFNPGAWGGKRRGANRDFQASARRCEAIERRQHEVVQHRHKSNRRIGCQSIAQCQGSVCSQLGDEPIRQRLDRVVLLFVRFGRRAANGDDGARDGGVAFPSLHGVAIVRRTSGGVNDRCFVLGPDVTAIDPQRAIVVDADEDARPRDVGRIVDGWPGLEGGQRRLDFSEPLIDLVR